MEEQHQHHAPYFELDLLLSVASGLGRSELGASGKRVYVKDDDCLGEGSEQEPRARARARGREARAARGPHAHAQPALRQEARCAPP